jgi:ABC-2 type transport system ATP-binding protein
MPILTVKHLTKTFSSGWPPFTKRGSFAAVNDISFDLERGEILGFLGHNGAGKTTTIQMLLGTLTPTSGTITYFGKDFATNRIDILKKVSTASGYDKLHARLTVWENLDVVGRIYNIPRELRVAQIESVLKSFDMWHMRDKEMGSLSAGQTTKVMLAKAFLPNPEIVILDEPTASLDPHSAQEVRTFILHAQKENNVSLLLTSHNMEEVTQVCDRVLVLKDGAITANSTPEQLATSVRTAQVHLIITHGIEKLIELLEQNNIAYKNESREISITTDEQTIADLLALLAEHKIKYSQISIDKPSLEDYFLSLARQ